MDDIIDQFDDLELREEYCFRDTAATQEMSEKAKGKLPCECGEDDQHPGECEAGAEGDEREEESHAGDLTCAICLCDIPLEDLAMVKGCDHIYCSYCILQWTLHKETCLCPQCKQPFSYLMTYRALDGTLNDFPVEESVVLLRRARWFEESLKDEVTKSLLEDKRMEDDCAWLDDYDDELEEDEELEAFYFSSAAGKARIVLGNRRFGQGGYIANGHLQARPVKPRKSDQVGSSASRKSKKGRSKMPKAAAAMPDVMPASAAIKIKTPNANGGKTGAVLDFSSSYSSSSFKEPGALLDVGSSPLLGTSPSGCGRRAKRNARRAAQLQSEGSHDETCTQIPDSSQECFVQH